MFSYNSFLDFNLCLLSYDLKITSSKSVKHKLSHTVSLLSFNALSDILCPIFAISSIMGQLNPLIALLAMFVGVNLQLHVAISFKKKSNPVLTM